MVPPLTAASPLNSMAHISNGNSYDDPSRSCPSSFSDNSPGNKRGGRRAVQTAPWFAYRNRNM